MALSIGIVGLPNVGKSTLFQAITQKQVARENYPFCTIDPNIGTVMVPDIRVDKLATLCNLKKKIYTTIEFVDIAGLVKGASKGEGLGNKFLARIKEVDAIIYVLRAFKDKGVVNIQKRIDILEDKEILDAEMILKDLAAIEKRILGLEKQAKTGNKEIIEELSIFNRSANILRKGEMLNNQDWDKEEKEKLEYYEFLTLKPKLFLINGKREEIEDEVLALFEKNSWPYLTIDILEQFEMAELEPEQRIELGLPVKLDLDILIKKAYTLLDLITFFTIGEDETRAWTIKNGSTAPQAGGAIHSDFEEYFIKAEVINWEKLLDIDGFVNAREKGLIRVEGKEYIIQDGDVITIKSGK